MLPPEHERFDGSSKAGPTRRKASSNYLCSLSLAEKQQRKKTIVVPVVLLLIIAALTLGVNG